MAWLTDRNVRLLVGLAASLTLLALILFDAIHDGYTLQSTTLYLLTALIWAFLGIDVFQKRSAAKALLPGNGTDSRDYRANDRHRGRPSDRERRGDPDNPPPEREPEYPRREDDRDDRNYDADRT